MRLTGVSYNPSTGVVSRNGIPITSNDEGYIRFRLNGNRLYAHRVAWYLTYGFWPQEIDHINQDKSDNRLINLRACTRSTNRLNQGMRSDNTSGHKGVSFNKRSSKWEVRINSNYYGRYRTIEEAIARRDEVEKH